jgi:hypothetical protein
MLADRILMRMSDTNQCGVGTKPQEFAAYISGPVAPQATIPVLGARKCRRQGSYGRSEASEKRLPQALQGLSGRGGSLPEMIYVMGANQ